ncbi:MAG: hypothetical protein ACRC6U_05765 [Fusobacteriaceae bacterium]
MKKSISKKNNNLVEMITISTQTIEYDYSYEENDLVHLEMNLIELPFFNKNNKIKKNTSIIYNFNKDKSSYLQVKPGYNLSIPGEKEEKIFYALLKIFQKNNFLENKYCYTDYYEIIKEMEITYSGKNKEQVKKGLEILRETHYEFQNSFYTKIDGEHHRASFNELKKLLNITFISFDKTSSDEEKTLFTNNKKEIIKIELSDFIKDNILNKIFLYFSKQDLLSLENAVTRNMWIKFTKWRNGKLFLKIHSKNLATKIPLSWTPSTYSKTILIIKKSLDDLIKKNLIKHYDFINIIDDKKIKNEKTYFEIYFDEVHNEKRNNFALGKTETNFPNEANIEEIEYKISDHKEILKKELLIEPTDIKKTKKTIKNINLDNQKLDIESLYELVNSTGKKLSTMKTKLEKCLKKHSYEEIKFAILYTNQYSKKSYGKYFTDSLKNKWYEGLMLNFKEQEAKEQIAKEKKVKLESQQVQIKFQQSKFHEKKELLKSKYLALPQEEQEKIEKIVYTDYITEAGGNATKMVINSFRIAKFALIAKYLEEVNYFDKKNIVIEAKIIEPEQNIVEKIRDMRPILGELMNVVSIDNKNDGLQNNKIQLIEKNENIIILEKEYPDLMMFKFDVFGYLNNKMSLDLLKTIMDFMSIEYYFKGEIQNYRLEFKFVKDGKSSIFIEKLV